MTLSRWNREHAKLLVAFNEWIADHYPNTDLQTDEWENRLQWFEKSEYWTMRQDKEVTR